MNYGDLYAHSKPGVPREEWQPLLDHLRAVAGLASCSADLFHSGDWAYNAALLHDLGKAHEQFQAYLLRANELDDSDYDTSGRGRINHSSAGAALATQKLGSCVGRVLAYLVAGHHAGLPDWDSSSTSNAALPVRLHEGTGHLERIDARPYEALLRPLSRPPEFVRPDHFHLWIRLLFSCLVDSDYLDTEGFMDSERCSARTAYRPLQELKEAFDRHMKAVAARSEQTPVNRVREEVLAACRRAAEDPSALRSLTVPTGGGKTLSAMAFALDHAVGHGKRRVIYAIPYTSIIEQTAQVLAGIFGADSIVEHHSNLDPDKETRRSRLASENWDAPIVVTTNVQFFESLYAAKPSRCRKLHNIVDSVVILDEAQLLPPELLTPCVDVLNRLTRHYGVTVLLSTATQPALPGLDPPTEIVPDVPALYRRMERARVHFPAQAEPSPDWGFLVPRLLEHDRVLCIVNTRRDCYDLFRLLPEGTIHLSALMCGAHRSEKIADIKSRLHEGLPVRVVSTQLVEAGVDIDFPVVFRALAGLDSIAQAAGRCNREGRLNATGRRGDVFVFVPPRSAPPGLLRKGEDTTRELMSLPDFDATSPDAFNRYFTHFYRKVNDTGSRFHEWLVRDVNPDMAIQFRTAAESFRFIPEGDQRPVFVRYGGCETWLEQLRAVGPKRDLMRKLQRFSVNLPVRTVDRMRADGLVEEVWPGFLAQTYPGLYRDDIGLDVYGDSLPVEELVL